MNECMTARRPISPDETAHKYFIVHFSSFISTEDHPQDRATAR
jgi:hypothetical protein